VKAMYIHNRTSNTGTRLRQTIFASLVCTLTFGCQSAGDSATAKKTQPDSNELATDAPTKEPPQDDGLPKAEELLAKSVQALGGEKLEAVKAVYTESTIDMKAMGLHGTAKTWWQGTSFYGDSEIGGVGRTRIGGTLGNIWSDDPIHGLRTLSGREAEQASWSSSVCMPCTWQKHFKSAKTTKIDKDKGRAEITLTSQTGDEMVLAIDLKTHLPVSQSFKQASPLGDTPVEIGFEDYREIEGIQMAHRQRVHASIMEIVSEVTKVELNPEIDPKLFEMPGPKGGMIDPANPAPPEPKPAPDAPAPAKKAADAKKAG